MPTHATMVPMAREAAVRAARIDPGLSEAQHGVAYVQLDPRVGLDRRCHRFRRALELDPSYGLAHQALGHLLSQTGRHAEGAVELQRARDLDPLDPVPAAMSSQVAFQAVTCAAVTHARRAIELNPGLWFGYMMLGQAQAQRRPTR